MLYFSYAIPGSLGPLSDTDVPNIPSQLSGIETIFKTASESFLTHLEGVRTRMTANMTQLRDNLGTVSERVDQGVKDVKDMMNTVTILKSQIWNKNCQVITVIFLLSLFHLCIFINVLPFSLDVDRYQTFYHLEIVDKAF